MDNAAMTGKIRIDVRIGSSRWVRWNDRKLTVELAETLRARADYFFSIERNNCRTGLLARLQLALQGRKQLGTIRLDEARRFGRRIRLAEIQLLDAPVAFFDLVRGDQDLPHVLVDLPEV